MVRTLQTKVILPKKNYNSLKESEFQKKIQILLNTHTEEEEKKTFLQPKISVIWLMKFKITEIYSIPAVPGWFTKRTGWVC